MTQHRIAIIDPLTLKGKEILRCSEQLERTEYDYDYRHTSEDPEHQITELAGQPALVPPLESPEDLDGYDAIVVASDSCTPRHDHLMSFLDSRADPALLALSRLDCLKGRTVPAIGSSLQSSSRRVHVAHPAIVATSAAIEVLEPFGPLGGTLVVQDPVSEFGKDAIKSLVDQARQRIQGASVDELIATHVLAFNTVTVGCDELQEEVTELVPDTPLAMTRTISGCFHGHLTFLGLSFGSPVDESAIREALSLAPDIEVSSLPLSLDKVPDHDQILMSSPVLSPDRRQLILTMMSDGLRVGGALTAMEILETLL